MRLSKTMTFHAEPKNVNAIFAFIAFMMMSFWRTRYTAIFAGIRTLNLSELNLLKKILACKNVVWMQRAVMFRMNTVNGSAALGSIVSFLVELSRLTNSWVVFDSVIVRTRLLEVLRPFYRIKFETFFRSLCSFSRCGAVHWIVASLLVGTLLILLFLVGIQASPFSESISVFSLIPMVIVRSILAMAILAMWHQTIRRPLVGVKIVPKLSFLASRAYFEHMTPFRLCSKIRD